MKLVAAVFVGLKLNWSVAKLTRVEDRKDPLASITSRKIAKRPSSSTTSTTPHEHHIDTKTGIVKYTNGKKSGLKYDVGILGRTSTTNRRVRNRLNINNDPPPPLSYDGHEDHRTLQLNDYCQPANIVSCQDGLATSIGGDTSVITPGMTCQDACSGECCISSTTHDPCMGFTGSMCKDGLSCSGGYSACKNANIGMIFNGCHGNQACEVPFLKSAGYIAEVTEGCTGDFSCKGAASNEGDIGLIYYSCNWLDGCKYIAAENGTICEVIDSCNLVDSCRYSAYGDGSIGSILLSCNQDKSCYAAASYEEYERQIFVQNKATRTPGVKGEIISIEESCNEYKGCHTSAADNGYIGMIESSCNGVEACMDVARNGGSVMAILPTTESIVTGNSTGGEIIPDEDIVIPLVCGATAVPTSSPTTSAPTTSAPTTSPTTPQPTTPQPTLSPSSSPSSIPSSQPSVNPSVSLKPSNSDPTTSPTKNPTLSPSHQPSETPSESPSESPSNVPSESPSTSQPTSSPLPDCINFNVFDCENVTYCEWVPDSLGTRRELTMIEEMEEYDQRELVELAAAAANSLAPSLHNNNNDDLENDNNNIQQHALVDDDTDDTTALAEYDMTLGSSSSVIYDFESNEERRMQTNTSSVSEFCMLQASNPSNGKLVCTAQDIKFDSVTGFNILDGQNLEACNCTTTNSIDPPCISPYDIDCGDYAVGTVYGACQGGEGLDTITLEMNVNFLVSNSRFDVGLFIATNGGSALDGDACLLSGLVNGTYGDVTVREVEADAPNPAPDNCYDLDSTGLMEDYPFSALTLSCTDSNGDGLLDFSIGTVWSVKKGDYDCDINIDGQRPVASSSPKCWFDESVRVTLPIVVPPFPVTKYPSESPTTSISPTTSPTSSPTESPTTSISPTTSPTSSPTTSPTTSPTSSPTTSPTTSPTSSPTSSPTLSPTSSPTPGPGVCIPTNATAVPQTRTIPIPWERNLQDQTSNTGSCNFDQSCKGAGSQGGSIGIIASSCNAREACTLIAHNNGSINRITSDSCNSVGSCANAAADGGGIVNIEASCNGQGACNGAGRNNGDISVISSKCNIDGDDYNADACEALVDNNSDIEYTFTTNKGTYTAQITLANIDVPTNVAEKAFYIAALEQEIFDYTWANQPPGTGSLQSVKVISINGDPVRLRELLLRHLTGSKVSFEFEIVYSKEDVCIKEDLDCASKNDASMNAILADIKAKTEDTDALQSALQNSGNPFFQGVTVVEVQVDPVPVTTSESVTVVGLGRPELISSASDAAANEDISVSSAADEDKDYPNSKMELEAKSGGFYTKSVVVAQLLLMLTIGMHHLRVTFF